MIDFGTVVAGLSALVTQTVTETAQAESKSSLAKLLKKNISTAFQQQVFNASQQYFRTYQERHGPLKVTCVRIDTRMELEQLYTTVQVLNRPDPKYFESTDGLSSQYRETSRRGFQYQDENKKNGIAVANQEQYLMVLGGPGIGKSTLLRKVGLEALKGQNGTFEHRCMPVFLSLQQFKSAELSIEQQIIKELTTCGFPEPEAVTAAMLKKGQMLLLLDGLDEVAKAQKKEVIEQIRDFVDRHSKNRFIASCRIPAYKGGFPRFKDVTIAPFEDPQIQEFIGNWFSGERDQDHKTADQCWKLLKRPEYKAAKELAQTPLLLTLLCFSYDEKLGFPKDRTSLYGSALDVVLKEWAAEKQIHDQPIYRDLSRELELELLSELAFHNFVDDQLFFDKQDVTRGIKTFLMENLDAPKHLDSEEVLEAIEVQRGILEKRARDVYSFSHLTFQEYLTAKYIINNDQVTWLVDNCLTDERWREVFPLVAGLIPNGWGVDMLLETIEHRAMGFLKGENLKYLITWSTTVTAHSPNNAKPAAKRAAMIALTLTLAHNVALDYTFDLVHDLNLSHINTLDLALALKLACVIAFILGPIRDTARARAINQARERNRNSALARALNNAARDPDFARDLVLSSTRACARARELDLSNISLMVDRQVLDVPEYETIAQRCWQLVQESKCSDISGDERSDIYRQFFDLLSGALRIDLSKISTMEADEYEALGNYLYACELMVRCKESAVKVTSVWDDIESRMLTLPSL